jgi:hypothetical protein
MRLTEVEADGGEHVDACIHAGDDGEVPARERIGHVRPCCGIPLVRAEKSCDLGHGV